MEHGTDYVYWMDENEGKLIEDYVAKCIEDDGKLFELVEWLAKKAGLTVEDAMQEYIENNAECMKDFEDYCLYQFENPTGLEPGADR